VTRQSENPRTLPAMRSTTIYGWSCLATREATGMGLRMALALFVFWETRNIWQRGVGRCRQFSVFPLSDSNRLRAGALWRAGGMLGQGDFEGSRQLSRGFGHLPRSRQ
jgi:hypothetical protein